MSAACIDEGRSNVCGLGSEGHQLVNAKSKLMIRSSMNHIRSENIRDEVKCVQDVRQSKGNCDRKIVNSYEKLVRLSERYE